MKKIMVVGQLPPPVHGLSLALKTFIDSSKIKEKFKLSTVNLTNNKIILKNSMKLLKSNDDLYYFTISQTNFGNLRDMFIILLITVVKRKKIVIHYHGGYYKELFNNFNFFQKKINRFLLNKAEKVIVLSKSLTNLFEDIVPKEKIIVCENCIQDELLPTDYEYKNYFKKNKKTKELNVLYLSNFIKSKGYLDVLEAAINLKNKNIYFHFAGKFFNEREKVYFLKKIQENNLDNIIYYDGIYGLEKKKLLLKSDVFILPTVYPKEGQPISILEAMGNMNVIISTNHAGIPDIVKKENGYLMDSDFSNAISKIVTELLNDPNKVQEIKINNHLYVKKNFTEKVYINKLIEIIEGVS